MSSSFHKYQGQKEVTWLTEQRELEGALDWLSELGVMCVVVGAGVYALNQPQMLR